VQRRERSSLRVAESNAVTAGYRVKIRCVATGECIELRFASCSPYEVGKIVIDTLRNQVESTGLDWAAEELEEITGEPTMWQRLLAWWRGA